MEKQTSIDILYEITISRLRLQLDRIDGIDTKIGVIFGLTNGIVVALVAFVTFVHRPVPQLALIFTILSALAYVATLILLFFAYRGGRWSFRPEIKTLKNICADPRYHDYPEIVKTWVAGECIRSLDSNSRPLTNKTRRTYRALGSVTVQGITLAVSCICYFLS